jgi:phosphoribosylformylglycinamidine synthase
VAYQVKIRLKEGLHDPQGQALLKLLHRLGYKSISDVHVGKWIILEVDGENPPTKETIVELSKKILANPITESFEVECPSESG